MVERFYVLSDGVIGYFISYDSNYNVIYATDKVQEAGKYRLIKAARRHRNYLNDIIKVKGKLSIVKITVKTTKEWCK